jgi:hypothetical protein
MCSIHPQTLAHTESNSKGKKSQLNAENATSGELDKRSSNKHISSDDDSSHGVGMTTNLQTMMHLLKGNIGTGILAMPNAFSNSGLLTGTILLPIIGGIAVHCMQMLVNSHSRLNHRLNHGYINYEDVRINNLSHLATPSSQLPCSALLHDSGDRTSTRFRTKETARFVRLRTQAGHHVPADHSTRLLLRLLVVRREHVKRCPAQLDSRNYQFELVHDHVDRTAAHDLLLFRSRSEDALPFLHVSQHTAEYRHSDHLLGLAASVAAQLGTTGVQLFRHSSAVLWNCCVRVRR